MFVSRALNWLI